MYLIEAFVCMAFRHLQSVVWSSGNNMGQMEFKNEPAVLIDLADRLIIWTHVLGCTTLCSRVFI